MRLLFFLLLVCITRFGSSYFLDDSHPQSSEEDIFDSIFSIPKSRAVDISPRFTSSSSSEEEEVEEEREKRTYGEPCALGDHCDESRWLKCKMGVCNCSLPSEMTFDPTLDRCVGRAGHLCSHYSSGPWCKINTECKVKKSIYLTGSRVNMGEKWVVPEGADLGSGICRINPAKLGELCDSDQECDHFMRCSPEKKCICGVEQIWSEETKQCLILHGKQCKGVNGSKTHACIPLSECLSDKCQCQNSSEPVDNGRSCKGVAHALCEGSPDGFCNAERGLDCLDGQCICKDPLNQRYEESIGKCLSLVEGPCNLDENCTWGSICDGNRTCSCKSGYSPNSERRCERVKGHGEDCKSKECDRRVGLLCIKGTCKCPPSSTLDEESKCIVRAGQPCGAHKFTIMNQKIWIGCEYPYKCKEAEEFGGYSKCASLEDLNRLMNKLDLRYNLALSNSKEIES